MQSSHIPLPMNTIPPQSLDPSWEIGQMVRALAKVWLQEPNWLSSTLALITELFRCPQTHVYLELDVSLMAKVLLLTYIRLHGALLARTDTTISVEALIPTCIPTTTFSF